MNLSICIFQDLIPGVQVQSTPALEAVMDIGNDDNEEEEEEAEEKAEQKMDQEKEEAPTIIAPEVKEEGKRRKDRIVKVEEKKTIKLQRKPVVMEPEQETSKMEVEEGTVAIGICTYRSFIWFLIKMDFVFCSVVLTCHVCKLMSCFFFSDIMVSHL